MANNLAVVVDAAVGIYSTNPTAYLSALARVPKFTRQHLDAAIAQRRLIRARTMRYSVYTSSPELLRLSVAATRSLAMKVNPWRKRLEGRYDALASAVDEVLEAGPLAGAEIRKIVDPDRELGDLFSVLLGLLGADCRIVRATNEGGWRSNRLTYARWSQWVGDEPLPAEAEAQLDLARRYVAAYGPVTESDLRWWTGWTAKQSKAAAAQVDLSRSGNAIELLDGLRLLPVWDVLMVAYQDRSRIFNSELAPFIYDRFGNATSVVYDRGSIVGVWDLGKSDDPLHLHVVPLVKWPKRRWLALEEQAQRIARLIGTEAVRISEVDQPVDLTQAKRNRFLAPLTGTT